MSSKLEEVAEKARRLAEEAGESVKNKLGDLPSGADWEELKELAGSLGEDAADFVRRYPLQSVLGAAAAGFLLGASLGRKNQ